MTELTTLLALAILGILSEPSARNCQQAYEELYGRAAVHAAELPGKAEAAAPKKRRDAVPKYPPRLPAGCFSGAGLHEVLVAASGKVERIWMLKTPCPEVAEALEAAIRQWEYQPVEIGGTPVPFCMVVSTRLHPR
jgi:hypothetical protein